MQKNQFKNISQSNYFIVFLLFFTIMSCALLYFTFEEVGQQENWVEHTIQLRAELEAVDSALKEAESAQRGYLMTGNEEYLRGHYAGSSLTLKHLNMVKALSKDNSVQRAEVFTLEELLKQRLSLLTSVIDEYQESNSFTSKGVKKYLAEGLVVMEEIREQIAKMQSVEDDLLLSRKERVERRKAVFYLSLFLTSGLNLGLIIFSFFQVRLRQELALKELEEKSYFAKVKDAQVALSQLKTEKATLEELAERLLGFLVEKMGFIAGRMFLHKNGRPELLGSLGTSYSLGSNNWQGSLIGEALERNNLWVIKDIPSNYWHLSSSLGEAKAGQIIFLPLVYEDEKIGLIELAAFGEIDDSDLNFLKQLEETITKITQAAFFDQQLEELLLKTQSQSKELQVQQEELKTNNDELEQQAIYLEEQQEVLQKKNEELEKTKQALEHKAIELTKSGQYKSEFLAKMSHELRTPLNGLLILSSLLLENKENNLSEQQQKFITSINSSGKDLLALINDILDLSKIEAKKLKIKAEKFKFSNFINQIHQSFLPQTNENEIDFLISHSKDVEDLELVTDRLRLEQILRNFLSNAIRFTPKGKIEIKSQIVDNGENIKISVSDTGIGIKAEKLKLIFDAFEQADNSISRNYGGTGLGLTITKELSSLLGGDVSVESEFNQGSTFSVTIPIRDLARHDIEIVSTRNSDKIKIELNQEKNEEVQNILKDLNQLAKNDKVVLIVEDDEKLNESMSCAVRSYGNVPVKAHSAEVALEVLNHLTPYAILLDIKLPGVSGMGLLEIIKNKSHLRHIPIHVISAMEYQKNTMQMGAIGHELKPITVDKIHSVLEKIEKFVSDKVRKVLLVEDDPVQKMAIEELISGDDIEVIKATTGEEALSYLEKEEFNCIILDLGLPDITGKELLMRLEKMAQPLPPIIIYTAKDLGPEEEDYLRKYSESIVLKGVKSPERLLDEVNLFLHRVESIIPSSKKDMLHQLRSKDFQFNNKTVLLADDDLRNVFALRSALEARGLNVVIAKNGKESLDKLSENPEIDLVLMDIMMPVMDGLEAMKKIRKDLNLKTAKVPIIALTAKAMKGDHEKCIEAGANDYLPKPVNLENLHTVLKVWLNNNDGFVI